MDECKNRAPGSLEWEGQQPMTEREKFEPTVAMIEAALNNLPNVNREDVVFALKAALSAAPTPPEVEPVGQVAHGMTGTWGELTTQGSLLPQGTNLYTRPAPNDELRAAAEDAADLLRRIPDILSMAEPNAQIMLEASERLRSALTK